MNESKLAAGFFFDRPRDGAPEFVKGRMSIKVEEAIPFLNENKNEKGYVNLDLLVSKAGKLYLKLNEYKPAEKTEGNYPENNLGDNPF
jgi:hypothetical protein